MPTVHASRVAAVDEQAQHITPLAVCTQKEPGVTALKPCRWLIGIDQGEPRHIIGILWGKQGPEDRNKQNQNHNHSTDHGGDIVPVIEEKL